MSRMNSSTTVKNVKTQALEPNTLTSSRQSRNSPFLSIASAGRISSPHRKRYGDNVATDGIVDTFHTNKDNGDKSLKNLSGCGEKEYIWKQCHDNNTAYSDGSGCVVCKKDDDHAKLLICEACNAEYHIYCLKPPLKSVPDGDFYCDKCKPLHEQNAKDGLDTLVSALQPTFTSRYGEIVWAAGGVGFGWWPACIYDPRLTVGVARKLALKNLGKKHLVYFFECHDAPFTVLHDTKLTNWDVGIVEEYDLGKTARAMGKQRITMFENAFQAATAENDKPIAYRLDWNHQNEPFSSSSLGTNIHENEKRKLADRHDCESQNAAKKARKSSKLEDECAVSENSSQSVPIPQQSDGHLTNDSDMILSEADLKSQSEKNIKARHPPANIKSVSRRSAVNRTNFNEANKMVSRQKANAIEELEDTKLFCKVLLRRDIKNCHPLIVGGDEYTNIGFISLPSHKCATFTDVRKAISSDIDEDVLTPSTKWKFYIPKLGPMSLKQESRFFAKFLHETTSDKRLGMGISSDPLKVIIHEISVSGYKRKN